MLCRHKEPDLTKAARAWHRRDGWRGTILHTAAEVDEVMEPLLAAMADAGYGEEDQFAVRLALEEAIANALRHGNRGDPQKWVQVDFRVTPESALARVEDQGPGFDPNQVSDPLADENLGRTHGRGLYLMRSYMNWVHHNDRGNCVILCRYRSLM